MTDHLPGCAALEALLNYEQADADGVMVLASRQAIHEVADELGRLRAENETLRDWQRRIIEAIDCKSEITKEDIRIGALVECYIPVELLAEAGQTEVDG